MAEFSMKDMYEMQRQKKVAARQSWVSVRGDSAVNRGTSHSAEGDRFRALYDRDEGLKVAYINFSAAQTQQFYDEGNRAGSAFDSSLKSAGHELSAQRRQKISGISQSSED